MRHWFEPNGDGFCCRASGTIFGPSHLPVPGYPTQRAYAWLQRPISKRAQEDERQTDLLHKAWTESGKVYGYRKLHDDLVEQGESLCPGRVARLAQLAGIKAQIGYRRRTGSYGGKPSVVVDNTLDRQFGVAVPDKVWVTDITYIRTQEGFAYLAPRHGLSNRWRSHGSIIDLYSRRVVGWSNLNTP